MFYFEKAHEHAHNLNSIDRKQHFYITHIHTYMQYTSSQVELAFFVYIVFALTRMYANIFQKLNANNVYARALSVKTAGKFGGGNNVLLFYIQNICEENVVKLRRCKFICLHKYRRVFDELKSFAQVCMMRYDDDEQDDMMLMLFWHPITCLLYICPL